MQIFIEQPGEPYTKNVFDKETGKLIKTVPLHLTYPYPYGYLLNTKAPDGDELDCFVITDTKLETASMLEAEPIGLFEWFEDGEPDHKILMTLQRENKVIDDVVKQKIIDFATHFFDDRPDKKWRVGNCLGSEAALRLIRRSRGD